MNLAIGEMAMVVHGEHVLEAAWQRLEVNVSGCPEDNTGPLPVLPWAALASFCFFRAHCFL
jgi:hypothetical protein